MLISRAIFIPEHRPNVLVFYYKHSYSLALLVAHDLRTVSLVCYIL